ncbi:hypothetical protein TgHK011_004919 [Trichoderma gracile]|nr:hypothetical protein TgHK011_004919 [Trichoderma gracile]
MTRSSTASTMRPAQVHPDTNSWHAAHGLTGPFVATLIPPLSILDPKHRDHTSSRKRSQKLSSHEWQKLIHEQFLTDSNDSAANIPPLFELRTSQLQPWSQSFEDGTACFWAVAMLIALCFINED